ncbi:MAG: hypothetical protein HY094_09980 [Candidatus Melainabacteria bacterium]|nr:hypothetical protein [Candidatus Melainabacteria bacterium]
MIKSVEASTILNIYKDIIQESSSYPENWAFLGNIIDKTVKIINKYYHLNFSNDLLSITQTKPSKYINSIWISSDKLKLVGKVFTIEDHINWKHDQEIISKTKQSLLKLIDEILKK